MTARTALIFGGNGQDGVYLARLCREEGLAPVTVARSGGEVRGSVADRSAVERLVARERPELVFHLAANSTTRHDALFENHETIATGTLNILEAVRSHAPEAKVFLAGSGLQFKNAGEPISEGGEFDAGSPYAVARIHSVYAARYYRTLGVRAYVGYLFHHESPLRKAGHVSQLVVQGARRIAAGSAETLEIGDIAVEKEWTFAGDVARGILTLVGQEEVFEAAIGSGECHSIERWLELCFGRIGRKWQDHVRQRPGFRCEYPRLVSDPSTMRRLGWAPRISMPQLAELMMSHTQST